jgi:predicted membrane-bound dolichyl-phosphate-mannose-protein mannosyltransferase
MAEVETTRAAPLAGPAAHPFLGLDGAAPARAAAPSRPRSAVAAGVLRDLLPGPRAALGLVLLAGMLARVYRLDAPDRALIFDEAYYVNASRVILGWPVPAGTHYADRPAGRDPNPEHPPLAKVAIAASMRAFGDTPLGWRLPSLLAGAACILLMYLVVVAAGADRWLGVLAAALLAFDNLAMVHSRIATLDMPLVALVLLAAWLALRRRPLLAGMACGAAALVKLTAIHALAALVLFEALLALGARRRTGEWPRATARTVGLLVAGCGATWLAALWLLDLRFGVHRTPWEHLRFMLDYHLSLVTPQGPQGQESYPWHWLLNEVQMTYLRSDEQLVADGAVVATRPLVWFRGAMNPFVVGAAPLGVGYAIWRAWRHGDRLSLWVVAWIAACYLPFYPLAMVQHRVSYLFYVLPALPAAIAAIAALLRHGGLPRVVLWTYVAMVAVGFAGYFPFRLAS